MPQPKEFSRVLHVFSRMDPGGAELRTIAVVERTQQRFDFMAVSGPGQLDSSLNAGGHRVIHSTLSAQGLLGAARVIKRNHYRVVHSHLGAASGPILLVAALCRVPVRIAHFRSDGIGGRGSPRRRVKIYFSRMLVRLCATRIVGVSPGSLTRGWRANWTSDRRCSVTPNGLDVMLLRAGAAASIALRPQPLERLVVINIGRAEPSKNRGRAIRIWAQLASRRASTLVLVGELNASDRAQIDALAGQILPSSRVVETGASRQVPYHLGTAHVLLMTSVREGLPGVVLESLAVGVPVVASNLPGTEWIASMLTGTILCDLKDADAHWVSAITDAADTADRDKIQKSFDEGPFTLDNVVPMFESIWQSGVRRPGA